MASKSDFRETLDPSPAVRHLKTQVSTLSSQLNAEKQHRGALVDAFAEVARAVPKAKTRPIIYKGGPVRQSDSPVIHLVHLTDWHIGQTTDPQYVEEFGENNWAIHQKRVQMLQDKVIRMTELQRKAYTVDELVVIHTGDYVSGDIHSELLQTNEFPAPVQAVNAGFLLGEFLMSMTPHFKKVRVHLLTTDNHGRITRKPQCEDGGLNNWGYVTAHISKQYVSAQKNIEINIHSGTSTIIAVGPERYLAAHGDGIQGTWGIPFYGIERKKQREAMARMNMGDDKKFTKILIGHFHTALNHEHWIIGGSLTGTGSYDHKEGRHSDPHQTSWFVHTGQDGKGGHGEFAWTRWNLR